MLFKDFAAYLDRLEKISSRLEITDVLGGLLADMEDSEVDKGIYLTLGSLGPNFDNKEFNMAVKMVLRSMVLVSGMDAKTVEEKYKKIGDVGLLIEELPVKNEKEKKFSIVDVFEKLQQIASDNGSGSQERKVAGLTDLLLCSSAIERKYIARMVIGKLRLGFSEKTILDALSKLTSGSKVLRKELDKAFQIYPDPGYIAKVVKESGMKGLKNVKVKTGVPVVSALCQRLNNYQEIVEKMGVVAVERKYDGTRVQIHFNRLKNQIKTYTRNLEESSFMFPELVQMGDWIKGNEVILDCEAVGYDQKTEKVLSFQLTITRKRKHEVEEVAKSVPLRFFVFDILCLDGKSLIEEPYYVRRKMLSEVISKNKVVVPDEYVKTDNAIEVQKLHDNFLKEGFEGAVIKKWDGEYLPGRQGWNWVKIKEAEGTTGKLSDTLDLVVLGYYFGRGKRSSFGIGAFLVGTKKGDSWVSLAKIGTGLTDEEFKEIREKLESIKIKNKLSNVEVEGALIPDVWVEPKIVVEIAADEITKSPSHSGGLALRFPRLIKFRNDKGPEQVTTWEEVLRIGKVR